jgi:chromosome partitioning protein
MKTIVIANQKGGSGKSTSTVHLAVAAEQAGDGPVVISDTDPQGSTVDWFNQRKKAGIDTPRYAPLPLSELAGYLQSLQAAGASYLFIDTAPSIGGVNPGLFAVADLISIPLNPTPTDLRALVKGPPAIKQSGKRPAVPPGCPRKWPHQNEFGQYGPAGKERTTGRRRPG